LLRYGEIEMGVRILSRRLDARVLAAGAALNALALVAFAGGEVRLAVAIVVAPMLAVVVGTILAADGTVLVLAALALELTLPQLNDPLPFSGGANIYPADLVIGLVLTGWLVQRLAAAMTHPDREEGERLQRWPPAVGLPLLLFAIAIGSAAIRGHARYGEPLLSAPVRMLIYAAIVLAIFRTTPQKLYRGIVIVFYAGAVWQLANAGYYALVGGSQSIAADLSTGGTRLLSVSVSLYLAGTFFLALINLSQNAPGRARLLHGAMLLLSGIEILLAYSRGTFLTVAILGLLLVFFLRDVRIGALSAFPLAIPLLVAAVLVLARTHSTVIPTFVNRITPSIAQDPSIQWRGQANEALWRQVRESPFVGVGFGRNLHFFANNIEFETTQDAHNDFLYLLAASGIFGLGSFLLVVGTALGDAFRRYRGSTVPEERALVMFAVVTALSFLLNGIVEPLVTLPTILLTIWALLLLPASVREPAPEQEPRPALASV
jgi:O-antigen ligase